MTATIKRTLNAGTAIDPRLPKGIERDPEMTGGTIFKWRAKSNAAYPAPVNGVLTAAPTFYNMVDSSVMTVQGNTNNNWPYNVTATGEFCSNPVGASVYGFKQNTAVNLAAAGAESNEILLHIVAKPMIFTTDGNTHSLTRIGKASLSGGAQALGGNWFQLGYIANNQFNMLGWFGGKSFTVGPLPQHTVTGYWLHAKPNPASGQTIIDIYRATYACKAQATLAINGTSNFVNGDTVTIGGKVYTFQSALTDADGNVALGANTATSLNNLAAAINGGAGAGTAYAATTTAHTQVKAFASTATAPAATHGALVITANAAGAAGNGIAVSKTATTGTWSNTATVGGSAAVAPGSPVGTISVPYVPLVNPGDQLISIGSDGSDTYVFPCASIYEVHYEDVTKGGVSVPDLIQRQWNRNKGIYA